MKNSPKIQSSIVAYRDANGLNQIELAKIMQVNQSAVVRWENGTAKTIRPGHWSKLEPLIAPYMQTESTDQVQDALAMDEKILIDQYHELSRDEKEALLKELIIKNETKKMRKIS